ncbi:MAG: hypothetical protein GY856_26670 [bacterium]|nr:hypothetical protein [bacterium]
MTDEELKELVADNSRAIVEIKSTLRPDAIDQSTAARSSLVSSPPSISRRTCGPGR